MLPKLNFPIGSKASEEKVGRSAHPTSGNGEAKHRFQINLAIWHLKNCAERFRVYFYDFCTKGIQIYFIFKSDCDPKKQTFYFAH